MQESQAVQGGGVEEEEGAACFGGGGRGRCAVRDIA